MTQLNQLDKPQGGAGVPREQLLEEAVRLHKLDLIVFPVISALKKLTVR